MKVPLQDLARGYAEVRKEIEEAILGVSASGRYILGPEVEAFEEDLGNFLDAPFVVSCASGTDAILLALAALEIGDGDEVITGPFSFFSTAATIVRLGARPVFADLDEETLAASPSEIRGAITPRTKAILPVHLYGQPAAMDEITAIAKEAGVAVVEDCAQAIGATIGGAKIGAWGDIGCFSFYPTKNLGAMGDAGAVSTRDESIDRRIRMLRVHGSEDAIEHPIIGINSRLDSIQAAVLRIKLRHLDKWTEARRIIARFYDEALTGLPIRLPTRMEKAPSVYHQYTIRFDARDDLKDHLESLGIGSGVYYPLPLHLQPCFQELGHTPGDFPQAETAARQVLSLPIFPGLTQAEMEMVAEGVRSFFEKS
ncbi:MAG: DegT/DnrJ/EryC1/StrS family aminotransferase [Planctomycetota bacterium]|nr:DegT/DnrJ/EryC1/StrS family aminotransferase [Planctomycetota bacterium]